MDIHEVIQSLLELQAKLREMEAVFAIGQKKQQIISLQTIVNQSDFWNNPEQAQVTMKQLSSLQQDVEAWERLSKETDSLLEITRLESQTDNSDLFNEITLSHQKLLLAFERLEVKAFLSGKHDDKNAIVSIHAGAGGTEAQDWAEMLRRMILRYAEKMEWQVTILDESLGQEAGIKSAVLRIAGHGAYGHLESEHGTHRLVRISPFDAEGMRHTSFASIEVIPEIEAKDITINPDDLRIDTFMSGGKGGQSVNTTYSAVRIVHIPTGITVQCQNERSQLQNKETAMKVLYSKLQTAQEEAEAAERLELRGEYKKASFGSQIRSYVLHPYKMVKDLRTRYESTEPEIVLNGELEPLVEAYLRWRAGKNNNID